MQLSDLLPAVGELIPYDYETIRTPEYETLLAGLLAGAVSQTAPHFVQIGGIPGAGKTTFCKNSHWDERLFISLPVGRGAGIQSLGNAGSDYRL